MSLKPLKLLVHAPSSSTPYTGWKNRPEISGVVCTGCPKVLQKYAVQAQWVSRSATVPGDMQLDWPVDQLFLNSRANFAFASTDRNTEEREPHVPGLNVQGQQRVHGPDDQEPASVRAAERDVVVGQPVDALVKTCIILVNWATPHRILRVSS